MNTTVVSVFVGLMYLIQSRGSCCGNPVVPHAVLYWKASVTQTIVFMERNQWLVYRASQNCPCNVEVAELTKSSLILCFTKIIKFLEKKICRCVNGTRGVAGSLAYLSSDCLD